MKGGKKCFGKCYGNRCIGKAVCLKNFHAVFQCFLSFYILSMLYVICRTDTAE